MGDDHLAVEDGAALAAGVREGDPLVAQLPGDPALREVLADRGDGPGAVVEVEADQHWFSVQAGVGDLGAGQDGAVRAGGEAAAEVVALGGAWVPVRAGFGWTDTTARIHEPTGERVDEEPRYLRVSVGIEPEHIIRDLGKALRAASDEVCCSM